MLSPRSIVPAGLVLALAVPGAAAAAPHAAQDQRSPDARYAAAYKAGSPAGQDLRSPDTRDAAAEAAAATSPGQDLRSPDTRDAARIAAGVQRPVAPARFVQSSSRGFDWGDAAIGAGGALGLVLVVGAAGVVVSRRRVRQPHAELVS